MRAAVTGTFDGVHRGHRFLLNALKREAEKRGLEPIALTFSRHPLSLISPEKTPLNLCSLNERISRMDVKVEVLDFNNALRNMTAAEFLAMLHKEYGVTLFLLGYNNTIGSDRLGASQLAGKTISGVEIIAAAEHPDLPVSSSAIRNALGQGNITAANRMLGRAYSLSGKVVKGKQLGRTLGFPTANVEPEINSAIPAPGVYVGRALNHLAVINIGRRPTVDGENAPLSIEAHLLDFSDDLYGATITLEFLQRLRNEMKFNSLDELKAAINNDIKHARNYEQ